MDEGFTLTNILMSASSGALGVAITVAARMAKDKHDGVEKARQREVNHIAGQLDTEKAARVAAERALRAADERADAMARRARLAEEHASQLRRVAFENGFTIPSWPGEDTWETRRD